MRSGLCALAWVLLSIDCAWAERLPVRTHGLADGLPSTFVDHIGLIRAVLANPQSKLVRLTKNA